jgi:hypothetical protein
MQHNFSITEIWVALMSYPDARVAVGFAMRVDCRLEDLKQIKVHVPSPLCYVYVLIHAVLFFWFFCKVLFKVIHPARAVELARYYITGRKSEMKDFSLFFIFPGLPEIKGGSAGNSACRA